MRVHELSRRRVLAASVGTALLAGCTSDDSTGTTAGPDEETGRRRTPSKTANAGSPGYPPGTSAEGVDDPDALFEATERALRNDGYDVTSEVGGARQRTRSSLRDERQLLVFDVGTETNRLFFEEGTQYAKVTRGGETTYSTRETDRTFRERHVGAEAVTMLNSPESLGGVVELGTYRPAESVEVNGRTARRFDLDSVDGEAFEGEVTEPSGSLTVASGGVVFRGRLRFDVVTDDGDQSYRNRHRIGELGEIGLSRPSWVEERF
jgi:hypothetical protein